MVRDRTDHSRWCSAAVRESDGCVPAEMKERTLIKTGAYSAAAQR